MGGYSVLSKTTTVSGTGYSGSQQVGVGGTTKAFYDSNYSFVGRNWWDPGTDNLYTVIVPGGTAPTNAKIGDSGVLYKENIYTLCVIRVGYGGCNSQPNQSGPDALIGSFETTYRIDADTADTAILIVTATRKGTAGQLISESISSYRITPWGVPTPIEVRTKSGSDESTLTIKN